MRYMGHCITGLLNYTLFTKMYLMCCVQNTYSLHVYSINGKHLVSERLHCALGHMVITEGHIITGNDRGVLAIKELHG